ncbi:interferon-induced, double-stranded RNA-activated protein kinase isoform X2 [Folsomia candida]|uniref:interferon-induced, double-stranded RNA-activated protein kinase isoform X2 n=1 Tax=Folsomia candida TaxID=158441 RepID=UPI00160537A1|nr:interferon-induced, double-stranded RNA-activated protein kinase isoform X2 [Folsomia candida]
MEPETTTFTSWFDHLSLEEFLGAGSYGHVFKAISGAESERLSAVKVIFIDTFGKLTEELEKEKERASREYNLMTGKKHENVLEILKSTYTNFTVSDLNIIKNLDCLKENKNAANMINFRIIEASENPIPTFCIQMELCGKNLRQWLNAQSINNPELDQIKKTIIRNMFEGLKYLHSNNIMHRDFRPENVMFSYSSTTDFLLPVKVGDFGLCRNVHREQTVTGTLTPGLGHDLYRAPETRGSNYGVQADIFSFGLVLWEVTHLLRQREIGKIFYQLVDESKTNLVKPSTLFRNVNESIISLTRRRVQDRIKSLHEVENLDENHNQFTVKKRKALVEILKTCKPGDTIVLKDFVGTRYAYAEYELCADNVTLYQEGRVNGHHNWGLVVKGNSCAIKNITFNKIKIEGSNNLLQDINCSEFNLIGCNNKVSNSKVRDYFGVRSVVSGDSNSLENLQIIYESGGILVSGSGNTFLSLKFKHLNNIGLIISGSRNVKITRTKLNVYTIRTVQLV